MLSHSDYTVNVIDDCVLTPESKTLAFLINAPEYNGTEWDQNPDPAVGEVFAAEMVKQQWGIPSTEYIMCNDPSENGYHAARNGPDHIILFHNDKAKYDMTVFHGNGNSSHPLIPFRTQEGQKAMRKGAPPVNGKTVQLQNGIAVITR